jgi:arylsulfatase A-like enzyme
LKKSDELTSQEQLELNRHLLESGFPGVLRRHWGYAPPSPKTPNVILISLDTLRGDSISGLGYSRQTTPWMDEYFGQKGVRFLNAQAPSSWTLPSHAGLFLSQFFSRHGVQRATQALGRHLQSLGEFFAQQGYQTAAFVDRGYLHHRYGFDQGFHLYDQRGGGFGSILPRCQYWLENRDASTPLFLFLHSYDIHGPYNPPEPFRNAFTEGLAPSRPEVAVPDFNLFQAINRRLTTIPESDVEYCRALYDAGILATDQKLHAFFDWLEASGMIEDPLVILFSDHGEGFGEHGYFDHGWSVYQELIHVPLMFRFPGDVHAKTDVETVVSLIDTLPTVFDYLDWEKPESWQGQSLIPRMEDPSLPEDRRLYAELETYQAMYHGYMKLLSRAHPMARPDGKMGEKLEAYNLAQDPLETENLIHSSVLDFTGEAVLMNKSLGIMAAENRREGGVEEAPPDEESVAELKAMGYLQ